MATTLRDIGFRLGYDLDKQSEAKVENSIKSLKDTATKMLGAIGIGFSLTRINALTEEFRTVNRAIKSSVQGLGDVAEAQRSILKAANDSRTTYESMANTVANLVKSNSSLFPVQDAVNFSSTVTKLLKTAGRSDQQIQSVMQGLNKSFQKGVVDTETLNVLLEQSPESANILARSLGVAKSNLLDLASKGQMSVQQLKDAFLNSADEINSAFDGMDLSISEALTNVRNSWGAMLAKFDETFGITDTIARTIVKISNSALSVIEKVRTRLVWLADKLGGTDRLLKLIAITAGAILVALNGQKIITFLKTAGTLLNAGSMKMLAIVAIIVLIALLVEDFFAFMRGENSFIGEMLKKAGVDTDEFRQACKDLWSQVKDILIVFKEFAKTIGVQLLDAFKKLLPIFGRMLATLLPVFLQLLQRIVGFIGRLAETVLPIIIGAIERLLPFLVMIIETILPVVINFIEILLPLLMQIIDTILPIIISLIESLLPLALEIIDAILPLIIEYINAVIPILEMICTTLLPVVLDLITAILPIMKPILEIMGKLVTSSLPILVTLLKAVLPILKPILQILQPIADVLGVIINGIAKVVGWVADGLGWVVDKVFGVGGDVQEPTTGGISGYATGSTNTPDTFIAGEKGPELVTGAAGRKVFTALETGRIFEAMVMLGRAAVAKPSTISNSNSSRVVNQYNEFVNTFNGDRAGQAKSAEAMRYASDDAVSVMARALAFAR